MHTSARRFAGFALIVSVLALAKPVAGRQPDKVLPPPDRAPHLILAHPGAHAPVMALAFAPDASALYVAGFDKQVRRYALVKGEFMAAGSFRVPIGPGNSGVVNALAVSPDGKWVAAAGRGPTRGEAWAGPDDGIEEDVRFDSAEVRGDAGIVYLFDTTKPGVGGKAIRGQLSGVRALAFADPAPAGGSVLVTAGIEWNENRKYFGVVRVFEAETGKQIAVRKDLPKNEVQPDVAAWTTGGKLHVAVAWDAGDRKPGKLLVWHDPGAAGEKSVLLADGAYNSTLAARTGKDGLTELVTGGFHGDKGGVTVRGPDGTAKELVPITDKDGRAFLPVGVAAPGANGTAVLSRVRAAGGWKHELRSLAPATRVELEGMNETRKPVLTASPDGRFLAVGGFTDNRVEVYSAANIKADPQRLKGASGGFAKVAFLAGEKLWLGTAADSAEKGGAVLDLDAKVRAAVPRGAKEQLKFDAPDAAEPKILKADPANKLPWRVVAAVGGAEKTIDLPDGDRATAAALLPAGPNWDKALGPIIAVAHLEDRSQSVQIALYDATNAKVLYKLGGPTLPVRSLAFSASRALLAGAGDDGTVVVWSLKNVARPVPMIEGLTVTTRANTAFVTGVWEGSPAEKKLAEGDVIESVVDGKGVTRAVKSADDFVLAVRTHKVGDGALIKAAKKAAVAVKVGTATGFRLPLFTLWANPVADAGRHDWVGWTASGPYEASGAVGEARIGWLTATGDPARPVSLAGANQYRKLYYKPDLIRRLLEKAEHIAFDPPPPPVLTAAFSGTTELRDGRVVTRAKLDAVVALTDPAAAHDLDRAELRWQVIGPGGASPWVTEPFGGRSVLKLTEREWQRGEHTVRAKLFAEPGAPADAVPVSEAGVAVRYVPPAPELAVLIEDKPVVPNGVIETENAAIKVSVVANAKFDPDGAVVALSWTGGKAIPLKRSAAGGFEPHTIDLPANDITVHVTATNAGAGPNAPEESQTVETRVRKLAKVPPPKIALTVHTPHDYRPEADGPFVVSTQKVAVTATVSDTNPITAFEWKLGHKPWEAGKLDPTTGAQTLAIDLNELQNEVLKNEATGALIQVRATAKGGATTREFVLRYDGLPDVTVTLPPLRVSGPELKLSGGVKLTSRRRVAVRVLVTSSRTGRTLEIEPKMNDALTLWDADLTLFPGGNQLGYVVRYDDDRKEYRQAGLVEVKFVRPPMVLGGALDVGRGASGELTVAVVSATESAPQLLVNGGSVGVRAPKKPVRLFGVPVWLLTAPGVPANPGPGRGLPVSVVARNDEGESEAARLAVRALAEIKVTPPTILLKYNGVTISPDHQLPQVGDPNFALDVRVTSDTRLTDVSVWQGPNPDSLVPVSGVSAAGAVVAGAGFELTARPALRLRPGPTNYVKVVASNGGQTVTTGFAVSYTPLPVRVVIESIKELNGQPIAVTPGNAAALQVNQGVIDVAGRVYWDNDDEPVGKDPNLSVVFVANGVSHLPVPVSTALAGAGRVRNFSGRVYLNSSDLNIKAGKPTHVRADLRSGLRTVPQIDLDRAAIAVASKVPVTKQRLHVLMIGVGIPEASRGELVRKVITSIGGKIPADNPTFTQGRFDRDKFEFARLYPPQLGYPNAGTLNALLEDVRRDIEQRAKRPGEEWVNDVVLLYYHGADWKDERGRWLLHTARTLGNPSAQNAEYAIRPDNLRPIPGMMVAVVNVNGADMESDTLATEMPHLRYAWSDRTALAGLLGAIDRAVADERTVSEMRSSVQSKLRGEAKFAGRFEFLPDEVLARVMGLKKP